MAHVAGDVDGKPGLFSHTGHYVAVINQERDGRLAIVDPYLYEGKFEEPGRAGKVELTKDVIALCAPADLDADVVKTTPYYLFWRK